MNSDVQPDQTIESVLKHYPAAANYLLTQNMLCIGCLLAHFHTLREIADIYHLDLQTFLTGLSAYCDGYLGKADTTLRNDCSPHKES
ncbi:MAG: hypothetical protein OHK0023_21960 [Anaerolineae bacterium]